MECSCEGVWPFDCHCGGFNFVDEKAEKQTMNKNEEITIDELFKTIRLTTNKYIEGNLCKYQNKQTNIFLQNIRKDMFDYKLNFQKMIDKHKINSGIINNWFYCFEILKAFLNETDTKMYIDSFNMAKLLLLPPNSQNNSFINVKTDRNLEINIRYDGWYYQQLYYSLTFFSTNNENKDFQFAFYIPNRQYSDSDVFNLENLTNYLCVFESGMNYPINIPKEKLQKYMEEIKLVLKNTNFYLLDLDYLLYQKDEIIKEFMENNNNIQLANNNETIKNLQEKVENKCETIEQLNSELTKQKNNFANLNSEKLKNEKTFHTKMNECKELIAEKNKNYENLIQSHNEELQKIKHDYQTENYNCITNLKEKIARLQNELNDKNLANKKLTIQLNDLNELYENLQEKLI